METRMDSKQDNAHGSSIRESPKKLSPASAGSGAPTETDTADDEEQRFGESMSAVDEGDELVERATQGLIHFERGRRWRRMAKRVAVLLAFIAPLACAALLIWQYAAMSPWLQYLLRFGAQLDQ
jgi:hypothetical protein